MRRPVMLTDMLAVLHFALSALATTTPLWPLLLQTAKARTLCVYLFVVIPTIYIVRRGIELPVWHCSWPPISSTLYVSPPIHVRCMFSSLISLFVGQGTRNYALKRLFAWLCVSRMVTHILFLTFSFFFLTSDTYCMIHKEDVYVLCVCSRSIVATTLDYGSEGPWFKSDGVPMFYKARSIDCTGLTRTFISSG